MHLVILHGYLLQGTGSNIYVTNIAKAWREQGHSVTVICQDRAAGSLSFVDEYIGPNKQLPDIPAEPGTIRVVVPPINNLLPVYVFDHYEGYQVKTIPEMTEEEIETHIEMTAAKLREIARQGVDKVLANHAIFGPIIAKRALQNLDVPYNVKIHGSAIEYTLVPNPYLMKYAIEGLSDAEYIFVGTRYVKNRVLEVFSKERETMQLDQKLRIVPPGMDPNLFNLMDDFEKNQNRFLKKVKDKIRQNGNGRRYHIVPNSKGTTLEELHQMLVKLSETYDQRGIDANLLEKWPTLKEDEPIILYLGKFLEVKGVGELLMVVPTILTRIPQARFIFVGFGTYREHLEGMIQALGNGDKNAFIDYACAGEFVEEIDFNKWFRKLTSNEIDRITVTGILDHDTLKELLPLASLSIVPSKWPEAFGMVVVEAMAAGVLPLCNYHAGLRDVVDEVRMVDLKLANIMSLDRERFVEQLPNKVQASLQHLYPKGFKDQSNRRQVGEQLRRISVEKFSWSGIAKRLLA